MKFTDAFWEKRNLGVSCLEAEIENSDDMSSLEMLKKESRDKEYVVVKMPSNKVSLMLKLQSEGYQFIESNLAVVHDLKNLPDNKVLNRLNGLITKTLMDEQDIRFLMKKMEENLFDTDRVYLDPHFSNKQASERYRNWITDDLKRGTELYNIVYKNEKIGFFTFKEIEKGVYYPFLASLYEEYKQTGLGFSLLYKPIEIALERGGKKISTYISTNNIPILKLHISMGFIIDNLSYVFIKHKTI